MRLSGSTVLLCLWAGTGLAQEVGMPTVAAYVIVAALIAVVVTWSAITVLRGSGEIFFLKTPLESDEIQSHIREIDGVDAVDDFHAWQICSQITVATVHVETDVETMLEAESVTRRVHDELAGHGVDHATVELSPHYDDRDVHLDTHCH